MKLSVGESHAAKYIAWIVLLGSTSLIITPVFAQEEIPDRSYVKVLRSQLKSLLNAIADKDRRIGELKSLLKRAVTALGSANNEIQEKQDEINNLQTESERIRSQVEAITQKLNSTEEDRSALQGRIANLESQVEESRAETGRVRASLVQLIIRSRGAVAVVIDYKGCSPINARDRPIPVTLVASDGKRTRHGARLKDVDSGYDSGPANGPTFGCWSTYVRRYVLDPVLCRAGQVEVTIEPSQRGEGGHSLTLSVNVPAGSIRTVYHYFLYDASHVLRESTGRAYRCCQSGHIPVSPPSNRLSPVPDFIDQRLPTQ